MLNPLLFNAKMTLQVKNSVPDFMGGSVSSWTDVEGFDLKPCVFNTLPESKRILDDKNTYVTTHKVFVNNYGDVCGKTQRVVIDSEVYEIYSYDLVNNIWEITLRIIK